MVQDGKDDLVHVLPQPEVDLLLFLEGFHELEGTRKRGQRPGRGKAAEVQATPPERPVSLARWGVPRCV